REEIHSGFERLAKGRLAPDGWRGISHTTSQGLENARTEFFNLPRIQAPHLREVANCLARPPREFDQNWVHHDSARRQVQLARHLLSPGDKLLQKTERRSGQPLSAFQAQVKLTLVRGPEALRVLQMTEFLSGPLYAALRAQIVIQPGVNAAEVTHIVERVLQLTLAQRAPKPVREGVGLFKLHAQGNLQ